MEKSISRARKYVCKCIIVEIGAILWIIFHICFILMPFIAYIAPTLFMTDVTLIYLIEVLGMLFFLTNMIHIAMIIQETLQEIRNLQRIQFLKTHNRGKKTWYGMIQILGFRY